MTSPPACFTSFSTIMVKLRPNASLVPQIRMPIFPFSPVAATAPARLLAVLASPPAAGVEEESPPPQATRLSAVSYTRLDVYKRQASDWNRE